jgi:hypothetical protein
MHHVPLKKGMLGEHVGLNMHHVPLQKGMLGEHISYLSRSSHVVYEDEGLVSSRSRLYIQTYIYTFHGSIILSQDKRMWNKS